MSAEIIQHCLFFARGFFWRYRFAWEPTASSACWHTPKAVRGCLSSYWQGLTSYW